MTPTPRDRGEASLCIPDATRRCPRLGSPVAFDYCLDEGGLEKPCFKMIDCWWETFDVVAFLKQHLSPRQFEQVINARPKPKVSSLIELIAQAQARVRE